MGLYWDFYDDYDDKEGYTSMCRCIYCGKRGESGNYNGWTFLREPEAVVRTDSKKEYNNFQEWCKTHEPCDLDFFAMFMLSAHHGQYGGLG